MEQPMEKSPELDDFSYHEVADRCHLAMCMIQDNIIEHDAMEHHSEQAEKLNKAITLIWEVYQNFGGAERKEDGK